MDEKVIVSDKKILCVVGSIEHFHSGRKLPVSRYCKHFYMEVSPVLPVKVIVLHSL